MPLPNNDTVAEYHIDGTQINSQPTDKDGYIPGVPDPGTPTTVSAESIVVALFNALPVNILDIKRLLGLDQVNNTSDASKTISGPIATAIAQGTTIPAFIALLNVATPSEVDQIKAILGTATSTITAPGAPTGLQVTPGSTTANLSWNAAVANGSPVIDYIVQYKLSSDSTWTTFNDGVNTTLTSTVTGLTASQAYDFRVFAQNSIGVGSASGTISASTTSGILGRILSVNGKQLTVNGKILAIV